jgi:glycosyltransferase involved in cell wall biosynthesis
LEASWGYAAELRESEASLRRRAEALSSSSQVGEVFLPNRHVDLFEKLPIVGITNGVNERNRPESLPELRADFLQKCRRELGKQKKLFRNPVVQDLMLAEDHDFDADRLEKKWELKTLLHREAFGCPPEAGTVLLAVVGRLVGQKNLGLVADIVDRTLNFDPGARFLVVAASPGGDAEGKMTEGRFWSLAGRYPNCVYFNPTFNRSLSKLVLAGSDFVLLPSRFEPCGLVDYEASLLGTLVIGHRIGGLAKVAHCAYLYEWLDSADRRGEEDAFFGQIRRALDVYHHSPEEHRHLMEVAMSTDTSWATPANQYLEVYQFGLFYRRWQRRRRSILNGVERWAELLLERQPSIARLFTPVHQDLLDLRLSDALRRHKK